MSFLIEELLKTPIIKQKMKTLNFYYRLLGLFTIVLTLTNCTNTSTNDDSPTLKKAFEGKFFIGAAINADQAALKNKDEVNLITHQFNSIVNENCLKHEEVHPNQEEYSFEDGDNFVTLGEKNNMFIVGHTLVWHSQAAPWLFVDNANNPVSRDTLINRMKHHIYTVAGRYKGRINGWDVVNEAISDTKGLRKSQWLDIIGEDFITLAFQFAHEADPKAELYYNDYNLYDPRKREDAITLIKSLQAAGCKVDGIGMQGHYGLDSPDLKELENSIIAFSELGIKVMITELDVSVLPFPGGDLTAEISKKYQSSSEYNPYTDGLPESMEKKLSERYEDIFRILLKHSDKISRVTFWGANNGNSWKNNWPITGRTDYPLLFDRNNNMVPAGKAVINLAKTHQQNQ